MSKISTVDARGLFTKMLIDVFTEMVTPTSFLRSFFRTEESDTKEVSIEVMRGNEKFAVDVLRGTEGNLNKFSKSTEKIFIPPFYREYFDATDLDFYDRLFAGNGQVDVITFQTWLVKVAEKLKILQDKIERAYERQAAQVFTTGVVTLKSGDNIDFKRKAESLLVLGGPAQWSAATSNPIADIITGATFLRTVGKSQGGIINVILGQLAISSFLNNAAVKEQFDIKDFKLADITPPQRDSVGGMLHGRVSAGSFEANIWSYPEFVDENGVSTPYINDKDMIILPMKPNFVLGFASVPKIFRDADNAEFSEFIMQERASFAIGNYIDGRTDKHIFDVKSAAIAIPTAVDQIHTSRVLG